MDAWEQLPKNTPSNEALPPATSGFPKWLWLLVGLVLVIIVISLLTQTI